MYEYLKGERGKKNKKTSWAYLDIGALWASLSAILLKNVKSPFRLSAEITRGSILNFVRRDSLQNADYCADAEVAHPTICTYKYSPYNLSSALAAISLVLSNSL